jgi:hypothetical protein
MHMAYALDFAELKQRVSIEQVAAWIGAQLKPHGAQLRGPCPICKAGGDRAFVITPEKGCYYCFGECRKGGDAIALVANAKHLSPKEAAEAIARQFAGTRTGTVPDRSPQPITQEKGALKPLDYLQSDHVVDQDLGGAEMADDVRDHPFNLGNLGAVRFERPGLASVRRDLADHPVGVRVVAVIDDGDTGALGRVAQRDSLSDALGAAGDDRHFAVELHEHPRFLPELGAAGMSRPAHRLALIIRGMAPTPPVRLSRQFNNSLVRLSHTSGNRACVSDRYAPVA